MEYEFDCGGELGGYGGDNITPSKILDMSIREVEVVVGRLKSDNSALRKELLQARMALNDRDEEILRLQRDVLKQKQDSLMIARELMKFPDYFKAGDGEEGIQLCLARLTAGGILNLDELELEAARSPNQQVSSTSPSFQSVPGIPGGQQTPPVSPQSDVTVVVGSTNDDEEKHVKYPLSYQYRHLRLQFSSYDDSALDKDGRQGKKRRRISRH